MGGKELKRLSRQELLELLEQQKKDNEDLKSKVEELKTALNKRKISIDNMGSLADASLVLSGIFEAAEVSIATYKENILQREKEATDTAEKIIASARQEADLIIADALEEKNRKKAEANAYWSSLQQKLEDFYQSRAGLRELITAIEKR